MSSETDIRISFEPPIADGVQFIQELDAVLEGVGFVRISSQTSLADAMLREGTVDVTYEPSYGDSRDFICFDLKRTSDGRICQILIDSTMKSGFRIYTPAEKELAEKIQNVVIQIHRRHGAIESKAIRESYYDDPWFLFSDQTWQPIPCLPKKEDRHEFQLRFTKSIQADTAFHQKVDRCMRIAGYELWRAYRYDCSSDAWRVDCANQPVGHVGDRGIELAYRHSKYGDGFVIISLTFQKDTVLADGFSLGVLLSPLGQTGDNAAEVLNVISDCLHDGFEGRYVEVPEFRCIWSTK